MAEVHLTENQRKVAELLSRYYGNLTKPKPPRNKWKAMDCKKGKPHELR